MGIIDNSIVKINIDGVEFSTKKGAKIIEVADEVGIYIPRFCYHKKLSIAANCRMCLVEVEKAPKLLPACATPVIEGMKIFTNTEKVIDAQRAVMEFLLINHPLDCPICDQGGECELQDLAVGYGCASSRFIEEKRSFEDYDLGPLVATDVTRCILCSRCVRFCSEIAGTDELGIINRGSNSRIFTFLKDHLNSEISGNVIDLCPVGALTAKPSRFKYRPWELLQNSFISNHESVGSNLYVHVFRDKVIRIVPKKNDYINESWISDKDRFSYEGLYSNDRINTPLIKKNNVWHESSWKEALNYSAEKLNEIKKNYGSENLGILASAGCTLEEFFLLQKLGREFGTNNIDHRLKQLDFFNQNEFPIMPGLEINIDEINDMNLILIIGSNITKEQPILGLKLRKIINDGGKVLIINPIDFNFSMQIEKKIIENPRNFINILAKLLGLIDINKTEKNLKEFLELLNSKGKKLILAGSYITSHPDYSKILSLIIKLCKSIGSNFGLLSDGPNSLGAWAVGFIPHRLENGSNVKNGLNTLEMLDANLKSYILLNVEMEYDSLYPDKAYKAFKNSNFVLSLSSFKSDFLLETADVILPINCTYENSGSFINLSGVMQSFNSVVPTGYEIKYAWEVIRDLGKSLNILGINYSSVEEILKNIKINCPVKNQITWKEMEIKDLNSNVNENFINLPNFEIYNTDALVRRSSSLQKLNLEIDNVLKVNINTYEKLKLDNSYVFIKHNIKNKYFISIDNNLSDNIIVTNSKTIFFNKEIFLPYKEIALEKK